MKTGKYRVYYKGQPCELLDVKVEGYAVRINGPLWMGKGVYRAWNDPTAAPDGEYIGMARLPHEGLAFHHFIDISDRLVGVAVYATGSVDELEWRLEE